MLRVGDELLGHALRFAARQSLRLVDQRQLLRLGVGIFLQFGALESDLVFEQFALRAHRDEFSRGHRERPRDEAGNAGQQHHPRVGVRAGNAEDQARVRHQSVVDAKHRCAQVTAAAQAPVAVLDVARDRRAVAAGLVPAVDRHPAYLHGREDRAQRPRTEASHQLRNEPRAQVRHERTRCRLAAGSELRAPDRGLRLGFDGKPREQIRARGAGFGVCAGAIEERRALLFAPAFERIAHEPLASAPNTLSIRAITSEVSLGTISSAFMFSTT